MRPQRADAGYAIVDVVMGLVLFGLVIVAIYQIFIPAFALSHHINGRLAAQQDVRLAVDRVARQLHETTLDVGRLRVYSADAGCVGAYQGCIGFVTAHSACSGPFTLLNGAPDWQATIYIWRDTATNELRTRCNPAAAFPATQWPPILAPYAVIGRQVVAASFTLLPEGSPQPTAIAMALEEQIATGSRQGLQNTFFNQTVFVPENR